NRRILEKNIDNILDYLLRTEMIASTPSRLYATEFGSLVSQLYLDPRGADEIATTLISEIEFSDLGLLQLICSTPDMPKLYVRKSDLGTLERFISEHEDELWVPYPSCDDDQIEGYYQTLKTTMLLSDWIDEVTDEMICERYGVGPGDIYTMREGVVWLIHASAQLARMFAPPHAPRIWDLEKRVRYGVRRELLPLVRLRGIGRVFARRLYNNGIRDQAAMQAAERDKIVSILGQGRAEQILSQVNREDSHEEEEGRQSTLNAFGGNG
ncbi:MAG TPA: ATP-dependent DNA helicase, partial [Methanomicrobiales archaeon]|nr:ATP-dependent DNA helicase [Methanomicrobiales archaeon]